VFGVKCTEVCDCGKHSLATARIGDAFLKFDHAGLARDLHDREGDIHFRKIFFVVVPCHDDGAPTCWMRSLDSADSAASISDFQSIPQRWLSMRHQARASVVEGVVMWAVIAVCQSGRPGASMLPSLRRFHDC